MDPFLAVQKQVKTILASVERVRAAGLVCLVGEEWFAVNVNLTVLHEGMKDPHPLCIESHDICAFDLQLDRLDIEKLLTDLAAGSFRLPTKCKSALVPGTAYAHGPQFRMRPYAMRDLTVDWPCDELTIQGGGYQCDGLGARFGEFVRGLPAGAPPIRGRRALERELDIYGELSVDRGGGHVYLRRPLPVRLVRAANTPGGKELEIVVEAYGEAAKSFWVSVMPDAGRRAALRIPASDFERVSESQFRKLLVLQEPGAAKVTLSARHGEVADEIDAGVPFAPMLIHQQFDPECEVLAALIFGPSGRGQKKAREFESGVAWLLHLGGCAAMHLGSKPDGTDVLGAPDLVARAPSGEVLIGECSLRSPDSEKLGKLRERARDVQDLLHRLGALTGVRAVFFVGEPCDASFDEVEFVDQNRLRDMLTRLREERSDAFFR